MPKTQWSIKRHDSDASPANVKKCLYYFALSKEAIKSKQQLRARAPSAGQDWSS